MSVFDVDFIKGSNKLKNIEKRNRVIQTIKQKIETLPDYRNLQNNLEVLCYAASIIEHLIDNKNKKDKINKKQLLIDAYKIIYGNINEQMISDFIDFLHDNGRIKKADLFSVISHNFLKFFRK